MVSQIYRIARCNSVVFLQQCYIAMLLKYNRHILSNDVLLMSYRKGLLC
jgi:hypothetical protein